MSILRCAIYARVSSEEQARHGLSIEAQLKRLNQWVQDQGYILVGEFVDAGISGGKPIEKRPSMYRLLQAVKDDLVDIVVFTKLDRWFRSLSNYYKAQEILDAHRCAWIACDEDYETLTANGKFKVNIMLSVSQQERERSSERIKTIMEFKKSKGEYCAGNQAAPWGYHVVNKHLVKDPETEEACARFWELVASGMPCKTAARHITAEYGVKRSEHGWAWAYNNAIYKGYHDNNPNYCEPYISPEDWDRIHAHPRLRHPRTDRIYIFTGLIICPHCGKRMHIKTNTSRGKFYVYYVCPDFTIPRRTHYREEHLEEKLLDIVFPKGKRIVVDSVKARNKTTKTSKVTSASLQSKMRRLAETYTDGLISPESYRSQLADLKKQIDNLETAPKSPSKPSLEKVQHLLQGNPREVYKRLTAAEKQRFWMTIIDHIDIGEDGTLLPTFL